MLEGGTGGKGKFQCFIFPETGGTTVGFSRVIKAVDCDAGVGWAGARIFLEKYAISFQNVALARVKRSPAGSWVCLHMRICMRIRLFRVSRWGHLLIVNT